MPYGRKYRFRKRRFYRRTTFYRRYGLRRRYGRRTRYGRRNARASGFPSKNFVKLKYATWKDYTLATDMDTYTFRGNSLVDPDYTGTGHQPRGFDQWAAFYNDYKVLGSKIKITPEKIGTGPDQAFSVFIQANTEATPDFTSISTARENAYVKLQSIPKVSINEGTPHIMKSYRTSKRMLQKDYWSPDSGAETSTNPGVQWLWHAGILNNTQGSSGTPNIRLNFELTFYAQFWGRKDVGSS